MYNYSPKMPQSVSHNRKQAPVTQRVQQVSDRDGEKLSPVDFNIRDAVPIQLPPLQWVHYNATPSNVTVRNTGFTLMINAAYNQQTPYVCSGPLTGDYVFAQIHFHWGEHDATGSGHAIDGVRYPLEMHVVHLKRDCANLGEAFSKKDGIAVMVHMFALREERNTHLDQLTAILQFIRSPKCSARLYPTPLAEIVQPFSSDYFLYWGAVGSPRGQYRILWFLSRNVLPVSAQQLGEFRQLCNSQGNALLSNTNKPYPLAERTLFLVSPSERNNETMYGQRQKQNTIMVDSQDSIDLRDAEYKSLADLDEAADDSDDTEDQDENCYRKHCRVCPVPRRVQQTANINIGRPFKVNEGDTSVEESCIDLDSDSAVTVKTEMKYKGNTKRQKVITNVNVTTVRPQKYRIAPYDTVYSVVSSRGSELHLRRKPAIVRPSDPSREQACMLLSQRSSTYQTVSAPSLTGAGGYLTSKKFKSTDVSNQPIRHMSSEVAVFYRDSEIWESRDQIVKVKTINDRPPNTFYTEDSYEDTNMEERTRKINHKKLIVAQENPRKYHRVDNSKYDTYTNKTPVHTRSQNQVAVPSENLVESEFYIEEVQDTSNIEENAKYHYFERSGNNKTMSSDVSSFPIAHDHKLNTVPINSLGKYNKTNNTKDMKRYIDKNNRKQLFDGNGEINKPTLHNVEIDSKDPADKYKQSSRNNKTELFQKFSQNEILNVSEHKEKTQKRVIFKGESGADSSSLPRSVNKENDTKINNECQNDKDDRGKKNESSSDTQYQVRLSVRTTISDHKKPGKKSKQFYVTKISPVETATYITPKPSRTNGCEQIGTEEYYYATPLNEMEQTLPEKNNNICKNTYEDRINCKDVMVTVDEYERSSEEFYSEELKKEKVCVSTNIRPKENTDQTKNQPLQLNPNYIIPQQTVQTVRNEREVETYQYEEEYIEDEIHEHKNETLRKRTKSRAVQPPQPQIVNKPTADTGLPRLVDRGTPNNTQLKPNENLSSLVQAEENIKNKNSLVEKTNTYVQHDPSIRIVDKTITGKVGQTKSTDVFIKRTTTEVLKPEKTEMSEDVNYSLVTSKHPESRHYIKEPLSKSQPRTIITQNMSLDRKVAGHSHVRQTVEYHNERGRNKTCPTSIVPKVPQETVKPSTGVDKTKATMEVSEEETMEQSLTLKKSKNFIAHKVQPSIQQDIKKASTDVREVSIKDQTNPDVRPFKNNHDNFDEFTVREEYTNKKSSVIIKSHQHTRKESNFNKGTNRNKTTVDESIGNETPAPIEVISVDVKPETVRNNIVPKEVAITNDSVKIKPDSPKTQPNLNENEELESLAYKHEEVSTEKKRLSHHTKIEKTVTIGKENEQLVDNPPIKQLQNASSETIKGSKVLVSIEDQSKGSKKTPTAIYQRSRENETYPSRENPYENNYEEVTEESVSGYTSQKIKKTTIVQKKGDPSYRLPTKTAGAAPTPDSNYIVPITKIEMPQPHYITRIPKQPLVEYEAFPVDPQQPFEIVTETSEEISSTVKTNKTFMMFKKINGKAILNQPSVIEPMKMEINHKVENQYSGLTNPDGVQKIDRNRTELEQGNVKVDKPLLKDDLSGQSISKSKQIISTKCKDVEEELNEYELSETSFTSQRNFVQKEKRYRLTVRQPSVPKVDINGPISCPRKEPLVSIKETSTHNMKADGLFPILEPSLVIGQTENDGRCRKQTLDLENNYTDNKTKVVNQPQISTLDKPPSTVNREIVKVENASSDTSCKVPVKADPMMHRQRQYTNERYCESTTKEEKYESSQARYVSMRGNTRIVNNRPSETSDQFSKFIRSAGKDLKYLEEEPTRDLPTQEHNFEVRQDGQGKISESSSGSKNHSKNHIKTNGKLQMSTGQRNPTSINQNAMMNSVPVSKTDGDIVIYIRQPRSKKDQVVVTPKITIDAGEKRHMTSSELDAQKVQVHEVNKKKNQNNSTPRNPIAPRKSKSAGYYPSISSSESSNEEQVIDTTHYNLTLKSETKVEIEGGKGGHVKSKNEVTIAPIGSRPGTPTADKKGRSRRPAEDTESESRDDEDGDSSDSSTSFEESPLHESLPGINRSPIKINTQTTEAINYPKLQFFNHWNACGDALLENNGKTLRGTYIQETSIPHIQGGPLTDDYVFSEVHFHWGHKDCCGAEHIIDGKRHALEAHFLYFKKEYGLLKEALTHDDGVAIVAVNLTVGGPPNPQLGEMMKDIQLLREPNTGAYVPARSLFSWAQAVIQTSPGYYSYKGCLTMDPPLVEAVTWIVFPEPIVFCCQQSQEFRKLKSLKGAFLTKNFRPPQPLNNRTVYYVPS